MIVVPFLVNGIAPNSTPEEWRWVFLVTAGTLCFANLLFGLMCSAEPAYWTSDGFSTTASSVATGMPGHSTISSISGSIKPSDNVP